MKKEHKDILNKLEEYLSRPGAEHLRFWQAIYNIGIIESDLKTLPTRTSWELAGTTSVIRDEHNISDEKLFKRIKYN